ncbi:MAG: response regulator [Chloroflexi bacterium]|uniref:histidine kinase n=1 Tax=Candidatus Chlorohelix allophototropha TaxID=3003348 RepID=A0A8T7M8F5_9CHLR|nr:response regulator [Chloroflexota bacterium]WJW68218.1 ATP-binding protein [Chloroflexota bacterium L227-S17]
MVKETILVVDDEAFARNAVAKVLNANGYNVHTLGSGQEAINFAMHESFDVLLTDFRMPGGLDGLTTIRAIQHIHPQIVAIIMTANTTLDLAVQSLNLGVHGFVVKPFTSHELLKTIQQTIERQRLLSENTRLHALMDVYATTEALITAKTEQTHLPELSVALALHETHSHEAFLFLGNEVSNESELIIIGIDPHPDGNQTLEALKQDKVSYLLQHYVFPEIYQYARSNTDFIIKLVSLANEAVHQQKTILEIDDKRVDLDSELSISMQTKNCLLVMPMKVQGRPLGALCIRRVNSEQSYSEVDIQAANLLAGQSAIAIENNHLFTSLARIEALREADRLRREFVSTVSHELRTPLTSIKGYATTLLRNDVSWNAKAGHDYLNIISEECDKLMELIDNILEVSKIEVGVLRVNPEPLQLIEVLERAVSEAKQRHPQLLIQIIAPPNEELPFVMADPRRIIQVLRNLINNAVKFSGEDSLVKISFETIHLDNAEETQEKQGMVHITIEDKGVGLRSEDLNRIFERFFRVDNGIARKTEGTGLGLAICRGIVEAHRGKIWAESEGPDKGSKFHFTLPVAKVNEDTFIE